MKLSSFPITVFLLLVTGARDLPHPHTQLVLKSQQVSFQRFTSGLPPTSSILVSHTGAITSSCTTVYAS